MAILTRSKGRKPLAESTPTLSWAWSPQEGVRYGLTASGEQSFFRLSLEPKEALAFIAFVAGKETDPGTLSDKRTLPEKLRALAYKLEEQGE